MIDRLVTNIFERCDLIRKFYRQSGGISLEVPLFVVTVLTRLAKGR